MPIIVLQEQVGWRQFALTDAMWGQNRKTIILKTLALYLHKL